MPIKNKILLLIQFVILSINLSCSHSRILLEDLKREGSSVKMMTLLDGIIVSHPSPYLYDEENSIAILQNLGSVIKTKLSPDVNIDNHVNFWSLGSGLNGENQESLFDSNLINVPIRYSFNATHITKENESIVNLLNQYAFSRVCLDTNALYIGKMHFQSSSNIEKLQVLREKYDVDYCFVTSFYGSTLREGLSTGAKIGTAAVTGLIAMLSPIGGIMIIPGDETTLTTYSYLINLKAGKIEWHKKYRIHQLKAVEEFDSVTWGKKVFKNQLDR